MENLISIKQIVLSNQIPQTDDFGGISLIITGNPTYKGNRTDDVVVFTKYSSELSWLTKSLLDALGENGNPVLYIENISKVLLSTVSLLEKQNLKTFLIFLIETFEVNKFQSK